MLQFIKRTEPYKISGQPDWVAALLHARGVNTPEEAEAFFHPSLNHLHDPMLMKDMDKAVNLIKDAAKRKLRAVVYGDYDVDGMCASALLCETLRSMGVKAVVYIPDRHTEGYGLNREAIEKLAPQADLLISVDCGITSLEEVALAKKLGMTVIITDHHTIPGVLPEADAVLSPMRGEYPFPYLCGAGVAWKLSVALKGIEFAKKHLDLAALATMADMVPLQGENRIIAAIGLEALGGTKRAGLIALKEISSLPPNTPLTSDQAVFQLAPRLNAGGRLSTASDALELLQTDSAVRADLLAKELDHLNTQRKQEEKRVLDAALSQVQQMDLTYLYTLVAVGDGWNSGVIGLAAGRLAEKYSFPSIVLSREGDTCVGSARSAGEVDLYQALKECEDLFLRFGGHKQAAGLTIANENIPAFKERFNQAVLSQLPEKDILPVAHYDLEAPLSLVTPENVQTINLLSPFGVGNPAPAFLLKDAQVVSSRAVGTEGQHLKMTLQDGEDLRDAIAFGFGELTEKLKGSQHILYRMQINEFRGKVSAECMVKQIVAGNDAFSEDAELEESYILQEMVYCTSNDTIPAEVLERDVEVQGHRGTLFLCRTAETASSLRSRYPWINVARGSVEDKRAYNTILFPAQVKEIRSPFNKVVLCDGLLCPNEAGHIRKVLPEAQIYVKGRSASLKKRVRNFSLSTDELREAYVVSRREGALSSLHWPQSKQHAALLILDELALLTYSPYSGHITLLPVRKCDPAESKLFTLLQSKEA